MENKKQKFNLVELASEAFHTATRFGADKTFKNREKNTTQFLTVSDSASTLNIVNFVFRDYFRSEEYEYATQKRIHIIDLDQYDYDYSAIKLCKTKKYKSISSVSRNHDLTKKIASGVESINKKEIDDVIRLAFDEALQPQDFFKFHEVRQEYRISISLVKNRKVIKTIKCNLGHFTLIHTSKIHDYQETESEEKKATRPSLLNPVFEFGGANVMVTFNDSNKYYRELVAMMQI